MRVKSSNSCTDATGRTRRTAEMSEVTSDRSVLLLRKPQKTAPQISRLSVREATTVGHSAPHLAKVFREYLTKNLVRNED